MATTKITEKSQGSDVYLNIDTNNNHDAKYGANNSGIFIKWDDETVLAFDGTNTIIPHFDTEGGEVNYIDFNTDNGYDHQEGRLHWDDDSKTLELGLAGRDEVRLQIGQEMHAYVTNKSGVDFTNGSAVYINGAQGSRPTIALANNDNVLTSLTTAGLITHDISNNENGYVTIRGIVNELDTSSYSEGDLLWLNSIDGELTSIRPSAPDTQVALGIVTRAHGTEGAILVNPVLVPRLSYLSDVNSRGTEHPASLVVWDDDNSRWDNTYNIPHYEDMFFGISGAKVPAANAPTWTSWLGNLNEYTFGILDYVDLAAQEIPHSYKNGTDLEVHAHIITQGTDTTDRVVRYSVEYTLCGPGEQFPTPVIIDNTYTIPANTPSNTHLYVFIDNIDGTGHEYGETMKVQFKRLALTTGTDPSDDPYVTMIGVHFTKDGIGSSNILSK